MSGNLSKTMRQTYDVLSSFVYTILLFVLSSMSFCRGKRIAARIPSILNVKFTEIFTQLNKIKCYCLSDLHADSEKNQLWVKENCVRRAEDIDIFTIFILPGDVGSEIERLDRVFKTLSANYNAVVYVPGNHEAWRRGIAPGGSATIPDERAEDRMAANSAVKLYEVLENAKLNGVYVGPIRVQTTKGTDKPCSTISTDRLCGESATEFDIELSNPVTMTLSSSESSGVVIFPLYSWYHSGWDVEPEISHPDYLDVEEVMPFARKWGDFSMCSWPEELLSKSDFCSTSNDNTVLARAFAAVNEPFFCHEADTEYLPTTIDLELVENRLSEIHDVAAAVDQKPSSPIVRENDTVISFSHFLPRQELCPEKRYLLEPLLAKVIGSSFLEDQIRRLRPHLHCFGHTHIPIDLELDGIRYVQWPKGYAREADKQCAPIHRTGPLLVFDSTLGRGTSSFPLNSPSLETVWTKYYQSTPRDPDNVTDLAPWVLKRLDGFSGLVRSIKNRILFCSQLDEMNYSV